MLSGSNKIMIFFLGESDCAIQNGFTFLYRNILFRMQTRKIKTSKPQGRKTNMKNNH